MPYELLVGLRLRGCRDATRAPDGATGGPIIVLDGVGIGAAHDADAYGDAGSDTLGNLARAVGGFDLPALDALGLGSLAPLAGCAPTWRQRGACGTLQPASAGKDSTTGHWELVRAAPGPSVPDVPAWLSAPR